MRVWNQWMREATREAAVRISEALNPDDIGVTHSAVVAVSDVANYRDSLLKNVSEKEGVRLLSWGEGTWLFVPVSEPGRPFSGDVRVVFFRSCVLASRLEEIEEAPVVYETVEEAIEKFKR